MKYTVYHATNPTFGVPNLPETPFFEKVAEVNAVNIEDAYRLTNNIDRDWTKNHGVKAVRKGLRSTSVGDIIIDQESGKAWRCENAGWKETILATSRQSTKGIELTEFQMNIGLEACTIIYNNREPLFDDNDIDAILSLKRYHP